MVGLSGNNWMKCLLQVFKVEERSFVCSVSLDDGKMRTLEDVGKVSAVTSVKRQIKPFVTATKLVNNPRFYEDR